MTHRFTLSRFENGIVRFRRQIGRSKPRTGILQLAEFAQFLGGHGNLVRPTATKNGDCFQF